MFHVERSRVSIGIFSEALTLEAPHAVAARKGGYGLSWLPQTLWSVHEERGFRVVDCFPVFPRVGGA